MLGAELPRATLERLESLDALLVRWGRVVDLSGFKTGGERHRRYFGEAFSALAWLPASGRALDIGSGGGSPALPLAVARPELTWTLVEANERKAMFLEEAVRALALTNVGVARARYEAYTPTAALDFVTLRGVAATEELLDKVSSELAPSGRLLWFSSEARVAAAAWGGWRRREGPIELVPGGGFMGVFELTR